MSGLVRALFTSDPILALFTVSYTTSYDPIAQAEKFLPDAELILAEVRAKGL